jgi:glycosyltransferase 2 family protein
MKTAIQRWGWPVLKTLLALAVLAAIGHKFYDDLRRPELQALELRPGWMALSGGLYLLALLPSAWYWYHLMQVFGDRPRPLAALRAYFVGQLGKYVPGKAVALILRGTLVRAPDVRFGVAIISSFYEVLATMAAGGMMAAVIFALDPPDDIPGIHWHPALTSLLLLSLCGVPLLPGVFNFIVGRMSRRFQKVEAFRVPPLRVRTLAVGLVVIAAGWLLLGLSVWAMLQAVLPMSPTWSFAAWMRCTGSIGFAYVAGFLIVFLPGGVGAREFLLLHLLAFAGGEPIIAVAVLLLRLVWTAFEVLIAGVLLAVRADKPRDERSESRGCIVPDPRGSLRSSRGLESTSMNPEL